jgi:DNA polymerase III delta prime subunit
MSSVPWVESHRPNKLDDIILDPLNKIIMQNIIDTGHFPNLLFYGPPGTGKTSSIINLVDAYQIKHTKKNKGLLIHLNASDERGIDIIRIQIHQFVNSNSLFNTGMKFVILDEVDSMTKNAQQALRHLIQNYSNNVRFCLICNYISRIDEGLQNEFLRIRFNQLPESNIIIFLKQIAASEKLNITEYSIHQIQQLYKSDIRSMINYMQSNQNILDADFNIINQNIWNTLYLKFKNKESLDTIVQYINEISISYNIDKKKIIKDYLNYIIRNEMIVINVSFLSFVENVMHNQDCKNSHYVKYALSSIAPYH